MFEFFLNPLNAVVGGALISSPILIHLINRMRFRRVRWAAMEFLLKSQKRNRRRLIIEQLILLLLRILLVLLAGLLLARFLGFAWAGFQPRNALHVVVFDDRLSMSDHWKSEGGEEHNCFQNGKEVLSRELARVVAVSPTPARLVLFPLSDPSAATDIRLSDDSLKELGKTLAHWDGPTFQHLNLARGVSAAAQLFAKNAQDQRYLHIISDFRQLHWREPEAAELLKGLDNLSKSGVKINLVDTAHPYRREDQENALYHDNLAIVELRPETRVAAETMPVQFTVRVANFSASERKNVRVTIRVDGTERPEASLTMPSVPPGVTSATFEVIFVRHGFNEISATLENEEAGLQADNVRYAVVEVRRQVPVLVIDGDPSSGEKPGGDTYHVRALLSSARGFEVARGTPTDLERPNLSQYPSVYLLNVRDLNDRALRNLESYVKEGGSVAFFLGERVNPEYYNKKLYSGGTGLFPAPLADRPTPQLSEAERREKQTQNTLEPRMQLFIRKLEHPIFAELSKSSEFFKYLVIERHFPVSRSKWNPPPGQVEELATLPNERPVADYTAMAQDILTALPLNDPRQAKYRPLLERRIKAVRDSLGDKSLYQLADALGGLLEDPAGGEETGGPPIKAFWEQTDASLGALRNRIERFRDTVRYGDPLVIAGRYGRGRTVAFLTTAGKKWNDWAGGGIASATYPVVMVDLQKYLTGVDAQENRTVGMPLEIQVDGNRYDANMHAFFQAEIGTAEQPAKNRAPGPAGRPAGMRDLGEVAGVLSGNRLLFAFDRTGIPGVYHFELTQRADAGAEPKTEARAYAYNVDTENESDLRRIKRDEMDRLGHVSTPATGSFTDLIEKHQDLSESAWFYLFFLVVLLIEQALAVHLSFHLKASEAPAAAQRPAPRPAAA